MIFIVTVRHFDPPRHFITLTTCWHPGVCINWRRKVTSMVLVVHPSISEGSCKQEKIARASHFALWKNIIYLYQFTSQAANILSRKCVEIIFLTYPHLRFFFLYGRLWVGVYGIIHCSLKYMAKDHYRPIKTIPTPFKNTLHPSRVSQSLSMVKAILFSPNPQCFFPFSPHRPCLTVKHEEISFLFSLFYLFFQQFFHLWTTMETWWENALILFQMN